MFRGRYDHAIDDKGRVAIPARFREALSGLHEERLILMRFAVRQHRCLDVYPLGAWRQIEQKLRSKSRFDQRMVGQRNFLLSNVAECDLDGQGRILIPPDLRQYAGITRDAVFTGDLERFRVWDKSTYAAAIAEDEQAFLDNPGLLAEIDQ